MAALRLLIISASESKDIVTGICKHLSSGYESEFRVKQWVSSFLPGQTPVLDTVLRMVEETDVAVAVLEGTDASRVVGDDQGAEVLTPRDNVLFELGLLIGALGDRSRVFLFVIQPSGGQRLLLPSDFDGQLPGVRIPGASIAEARSHGGGKSGGTAMAEAVASSCDTAVEHFETILRIALVKTPPSANAGESDEEVRATATSMWRKRFRAIDASAVEPGMQVLHPLFGIGTVIELQQVGGRGYTLVDFATAVRRVPEGEPLFDPLERPPT